MLRAPLARIRRDQDLEALAKQGLRLGRDVYVGRSTYIDPGFVWLISIGDETSIGSGVTILAHDFSTNRHIGYSLVAPVSIGRRVSIGANVVVLPGVAIGDEAIIGAGSIVRRDVPSGALVVGNPAAVVGATSDYVAKHRARLDGRVWANTQGMTAAEKQRMLEDLQEHGSGYAN
jgi:maltose O-acetyltransferase